MEIQCKLPGLQQIYDYITEELQELKNKLKRNYPDNLDDVNRNKVQNLLAHIQLELKERQDIENFTIHLDSYKQNQNSYSQIKNFNEEFAKIATKTIQQQKQKKHIYSRNKSYQPEHIISHKIDQLSQVKSNHELNEQNISVFSYQSNLKSSGSFKSKKSEKNKNYNLLVETLAKTKMENQNLTLSKGSSNIKNSEQRDIHKAKQKFKTDIPKPPKHNKNKKGSINIINNKLKPEQQKLIMRKEQTQINKNKEKIRKVEESGDISKKEISKEENENSNNIIQIKQDQLTKALLISKQQKELILQNIKKQGITINYELQNSQQQIINRIQKQEIQPKLQKEKLRDQNVKLLTRPTKNKQLSIKTNYNDLQVIENDKKTKQNKETDYLANTVKIQQDKHFKQNIQNYANKSKEKIIKDFDKNKNIIEIYKQELENQNQNNKQTQQQKKKQLFINNDYSNNKKQEQKIQTLYKDQNKDVNQVQIPEEIVELQQQQQPKKKKIFPEFGISKIIKKKNNGVIEIIAPSYSEKWDSQPLLLDKEYYTEQYWNKKLQQVLSQNVSLQINNKQQQTSNFQQRQIIITQIQTQSQLSENKDLTQQVYSEQKEKQKINMKKKKTAKAITIPKSPIFPISKDYSNIFPCFNSILSAYYLKNPTSFSLDINILFKELISIFTNHLNYFKEHPYIAKPMPTFQLKSSIYGTDPNKLVLYAQRTWISLQWMVERQRQFSQNIYSTHFQLNAQEKYYRVIRNRDEVYDIITSGFLRKKQWSELPRGCNLRSSWNFLWTWSKPDLDLTKLLAFQKVNHFPYNKNLVRKDLLYKNIQYLRKNCRYYNFNIIPVTFSLPKEFTQLSVKFHEDQLTQGPNLNIWIMKPIGKSRGRGIKLINNLAELSYIQNIVVQKYIKNPLLLDGYKFDIRLYVLVTNMHPLEAFVYKQGFARMSTQKFSMDFTTLKNNFIHLTNFSIQKHNYDKKLNQFGGSKISLKMLREKLIDFGIEWQLIWEKINEVVVKSLIASSGSIPNLPNSFQLFGYDIILDTDLNPFLLEVNSSPSLQRNHIIDQIVKQNLIDDILNIVNPVCFNKEELLNVLSERLNGSMVDDNVDIGRVLNWKDIRQVGEIPCEMGLFERIAPQKLSLQLQKILFTGKNFDRYGYKNID